jgi:hypothetical protein
MEKRKAQLSPVIKWQVIIAVMLYLAGFRCMWMGEVPWSHRPAQPFLSAAYTSQHFTEAE